MIKLEFRKYPSGSWTDWSQYLLEAPVISRKVESDKAGEAGIIVYDSVNIALRYEPGNSVYQAFDESQLTSANRYLFRISACHFDKTYTTLFEGMADFTTIKFPHLSKTITFDVLDKLSALNIIVQEQIRQAGNILHDVNPSELSTRIKFYKYPNAWDINMEYEGNGGLIVDTTNDNTPDLGDIIQVNFLRDSSNQIVSESAEYLGLVTFKYFDSSFNNGRTFLGLNSTFPDYYAASTDKDKTGTCDVVARTNSVWFSSLLYGTDVYVKRYRSDYPIRKWDGIHNVPGYEIIAFDAIKIISALIKKAWGDVSIINRLGRTEYPIPIDYFPQLLTGGVFEMHPLDAIKLLADSMRCYIFFDRNGDLVLQAKNAIANFGTDKIVNNPEESFGSEISYFWDKIVDAVTINVKSWLMNEKKEQLVGGASITKPVAPGSAEPIKPRNEMKREVLSNDSGLDTQEKLNSYALMIANEYLSFYGRRHYACNISLPLNNERLLWDLLDTILLDEVRYFVSNLEIDLAAWRVNAELVSVTSYDYDLNQGCIPKTSGGSESYSGSAASIAMSAIKPGDFEAALTIRPEAYGAKGDGIADDSEAIRQAFAAAKGKILTFSKAKYKVTGKLEIDLAGKDLEIHGSSETQIVVAYSESLSADDHFGAITIRNAKKVVVNDFKTEGAAATAFPADGLQADLEVKKRPALMLIQDSEEVTVNNAVFSKGERAGLMIKNVANAYINGTTCSENKYAGLSVIATKHVVIDGGEYSFNGLTPTINGYGITCEQQNGTGIDNENIEICNAKVMYNYRKGIDIHNGIKVNIHDNSIKGFVYAAIYAVNAAGAKDHVEFVRDVIIANNHVENDLNWFQNLNFDPSYMTQYGAFSHPIQFGTYSQEAPEGTADYPFGTVWESDQPGNTRSDWYTGGNGGSTIVQGNIIKNCTVSKNGVNYCNYMVHGFGSAQRALKILDNVFDTTTCDTAVYISTATRYKLDAEGQPKSLEIDRNHFLDLNCRGNNVVLACAGKQINFNNNVIYNCKADTGTTPGASPGAFRVLQYGSGSNIDLVRVSNNNIHGTFPIGIIIQHGNDITVNDNKFAGNITEKIFIPSDRPRKVFNNTDATGFGGVYQTINTPNFDSHNSGDFTVQVETSDNPNQPANLITVNASGDAGGGYNSGVTLINVETIVTAANNAFKAIYRQQAHCGNVNGAEAVFSVNDSFTCTFDDAGVSDNDPDLASIRPVLSWFGTGNTRTLRTICPTPYASYYTTCKFTSWRLNPSGDSLASVDVGAVTNFQSGEYTKGSHGINKKALTDTLSLKALVGKNILGLYAADGSTAFIFDKDKNAILYNSLHIRNKANSGNIPFATRNTAAAEAVLDLGNIGNISASGQFISSKATGAPLVVASTALVQNLNADLLDGKHASAFALSAHVHAIADVTGLQTALDSKAAADHTHTGYALSVHRHDASEIDYGQAVQESLDTVLDDIYTQLGGKASAGHTHSIANVTGLQAALDAKAASGHDHTGISGNAATATKLATARKINGVPFDGTADININGDSYSGWGLQANGANTSNVASGDVVNIVSGTNISLSKSGHSITISNTYSYVHPAAHAASMITEDTSRRFVSDTEKDTWNGKAAGTHQHVKSQITDFAHTHAIADVTGLQTALDGKAASGHTHNYDNYGSWSLQVNSGTSSGITSGTIVNLLNGSNISITRSGNAITVANTYSYTHPATHAASMITEDSTHRFITDAERTAWNSSQGVSHNHSNLTTLAGITDTLVTHWNSAYNHAISSHVGPTGANASGTWGISITGNAASATNADTLDGNHASAFSLASHTHTGYALATHGHDASEIDYGQSVQQSLDTVIDDIYTQLNSKAATGHIHTIANVTGLQVALDAKASSVHDHTGISGNAATATKLAVARTINGVPFDGSANITIAAQAGAHTHTNDSSIGGPYALAGHLHTPADVGVNYGVNGGTYLNTQNGDTLSVSTIELIIDGVSWTLYGYLT